MSVEEGEEHRISIWKLLHPELLSEEDLINALREVSSCRQDYYERTYVKHFSM